ncbi:MAG: dephospho-CoA kinase [Rhizobiales bacterium]|nr:dephospho-CoA kinase [Hyphomicrobiales bacterium]
MSAKPHRHHPFVLGLTGSIGMGKSAVARMFSELGIPVFDSDAVVHRLQGAGGKLLGAIEAAFPGTVGPAGVDRAELGRRVFADQAALHRLEAIVHPAIGAERAEFLLEHAGKPLVVFDIPLLFEKPGTVQVDAVLVVSAPVDVQRSRVLSRPGMSPQRLAAILDLQVPDAEKRARADYVIDTGGSLEQTREAVAALVKNLTQ